jgi:Ca2+-binding RTX toxin-like protein
MRATESRIRKGRAAAAAVLGLALAGLTPAVAQAATSVSIDPQNRILVVGDTSSNDVSISDQSDPSCPGGPPCYEVRTRGGTTVATPPCVTLPGPPSAYEATVLCPRAGVTGITGFGREGHDGLLISDFVFGLAVPSQLDGGPGDDRLMGSVSNDRLVGGIDDDELRGGGGLDRLNGNPGDDRLYGAKGVDVLKAGPGRDFLFGGIGNDDLLGGSGKDLLDGLQGRKDHCVGGGGKDVGKRCERTKSIP